MRAAMAFCLLILCAASAQAALAASEPLSWPDCGPYQMVGKPAYGSGSIRMPRQVVAAVRRRVVGDPAQWYIVNRFGAGDWKDRVVGVAGWAEDMSLLVEHGKWMNLNAPANLPAVAAKLGPLPLADLQDRAKLKDYLTNALRLQRCLEVVFLDPEFWREESGQHSVESWLGGNGLGGTEKNPRALRALCRAWLVTRNREHVTIRCNIMNGHGGVERWTFRLRTDAAMVHLEGLDERRLRKDDTFVSQKGDPIGLLRLD